MKVKISPYLETCDRHVSYARLVGPDRSALRTLDQRQASPECVCVWSTIVMESYGVR